VYNQTHQIKAPSPLEADIEKIDHKCYGVDEGSIKITASGGTGTYQYSIDGGVNYQADPFFELLPKGVYQVVVKDSNECTLEENVRIIPGRYFSIHHPEPKEIKACSTQEEIDLAFQEWLKEFKYYGGLDPHKETLIYDSIPGPC